MPMLIVAIYRTTNDVFAIRKAVEAVGVPADDVRISDFVDPVARNAPASIEKPGGFMYWLAGISQVDLAAYRRAIDRGRTIVAVLANETCVDRVAEALQRFQPIDLGAPEELTESERVLAEDTGAIAPTSGSPGGPRRYSLANRPPRTK